MKPVAKRMKHSSSGGALAAVKGDATMSDCASSSLLEDDIRSQPTSLRACLAGRLVDSKTGVDARFPGNRRVTAWSFPVHNFCLQKPTIFTCLSVSCAVSRPRVRFKSSSLATCDACIYVHHARTVLTRWRGYPNSRSCTAANLSQIFCGQQLALSLSPVALPITRCVQFTPPPPSS